VAAPRWTVDLADSATLARLTPLRGAAQRHLEIELNQPGALSYNLPLTGDESRFVDHIRTASRLKLDGRVVWSGMVWGTTEDSPGGHMAVNNVGWGQRLYKRLINPGQESTYTNTDRGLIAFNLLAKANALGPTVAGAPSSTMITAGTRQACPVSTKSYSAFQNIGEMIHNWSQIENGFDYRIDPNTRRMDIFYPRYGDDRENVVFVLTPDDAAGLSESRYRYQGLKSAQRTMDSSRFRNKEWVLGAGGQTGFAEDVTSQQTYGLFENQDALMDVNNTQVLALYANEELFLFKRPWTTFTVQPMPYEDAGVQMPTLFQDFDLGDTVYFTVQHGTFRVRKQAIRIFGVTMTISEEGTAVIDSLKVALA
jgi:hypothetical protein